ncbi:MAG: RNA polymerase sigma factor [Actinomycetota bacterium]
MTDATALERVYREEGERLWRAVFAYAGDRQIADDAVAEAFAQALRRGDALRDPARWVWAVAFRVAKGELAGRRKSDGEPREAAYDMPEPARDVVDALARLSPRQRSCVVLHHYAGYPVKEIATMLGSTTAAVKVHLSQGRKRLRALLIEEEDDA